MTDNSGWDGGDVDTRREKGAEGQQGARQTPALGGEVSTPDHDPTLTRKLSVDRKHSPNLDRICFSGVFSEFFGRIFRLVETYQTTVQLIVRTTNRFNRNKL